MPNQSTTRSSSAHAEAQLRARSSVAAMLRRHSVIEWQHPSQPPSKMWCTAASSMGCAAAHQLAVTVSSSRPTPEESDCKSPSFADSRQFQFAQTKRLDAGIRRPRRINHNSREIRTGSILSPAA